MKLRRDALGDHPLCLDAVRDPIPQLTRIAAPGSARDGDADVVEPLRAQARDEVLAQTLGVRADAVRLVQDHELSRETRPPAPKVGVVEHRVAVLLGIRDPHHRVYAGQKLVHARAMLGRRRIDIREVEDRDVGEGAVCVVPDLAHVEPPEQRRRLVARALCDPGERRSGGRAACTGRAHDAAGKRVEQARLADTGPSDEGEHVGGPLESESLTRVREHATRARRVEPEHRGRVDRVVER